MILTVFMHFFSFYIEVVVEPSKHPSSMSMGNLPLRQCPRTGPSRQAALTPRRQTFDLQSSQEYPRHQQNQRPVG